MSTLPLGSGAPASIAGIPGADKRISVSASIDGNPGFITVKVFEFGSFLRQRGASRIFFDAAACNNAAQKHHINILERAELLTKRHRICMESNDAQAARFLHNPRGLSWAQVAVDTALLNFYNVGEAAAQQEVPLGYEDDHHQLAAIIKDFERTSFADLIDNMEVTAPIKTIVLEIAADEAEKLGITSITMANRCGCNGIFMPDGRIGIFSPKEEGLKE